MEYEVQEEIEDANKIKKREEELQRLRKTRRRRLTLIGILVVGIIIAMVLMSSPETRTNIGSLGNKLLEGTTFYVIGVTPSVISAIPLEGTSAFADTVFNISANVTHNVTIQAVIAQIEMPNGTFINLTLTDDDGDDIYNSTFGNTGIIGFYNITYLANDTDGNLNDSEQTYFDVDTSGAIDVIDSTFKVLAVASINMIRNSTSLDLDINFTDYAFYNIFISGYSEDNNKDILRVENQTNFTAGSKTYAIDPTYLNFTNLSVSATANSDAVALFKCTDFDFMTQMCSSNNWTKVMNLTGGANYSFMIWNNTDPAFSESATVFACFKDGSSVSCSITDADIANNDSSDLNSSCSAPTCGELDIGTGGLTYLELHFNFSTIDPALTPLEANLTTIFANEKTTFTNQQLQCFDGTSFINYADVATNGADTTITTSLNETCFTTPDRYNDVRIRWAYDPTSADSGKTFFDFFNLTINAELLDTRNATVSVSGQGQVADADNSSLLDCPGDCFETYPSNRLLNLSATPANGWEFSHWGGDCTGQSGTTCQINMSTNRTIEGTFNVTSVLSNVSKIIPSTPNTVPYIQIGRKLVFP